MKLVNKCQKKKLELNSIRDTPKERQEMDLKFSRKEQTDSEDCKHTWIGRRSAGVRKPKCIN